MSSVYLSLVIPVYNEEVNLRELVERCVKTCNDIGRTYEVVLVDDGSRDQSIEMIKQASAEHEQIVGVLLNRNYGQHSAVMAGLAQSRGDVVVTLDADLQNPPEEIPKLLAEIDKGADVVGSVRQLRKDSLFRKLSSALINKAVQMATGVLMHDYGCMLRAYRRQVVDAMLQCHERSTFIPVLGNMFAHKTAEVAVEHAKRENDQSKYSLLKLINLQFDLLTSMTTFPLRLLSLIGGGLAVLGFVLAGLLIVLRLIYGPEWAAQGVFTVFAILFIFMGTQILAMGLLGEYIGRIYNDVRARPRYFIREIVSQQETTTEE
ncbi:MAG: glycosyltransferase [Gammaproteobacteria bacterium]|jgi:undecaprenyl-phosphate 4-deoxy-4-formamido-L-arabinose transferase